MVNSQETIASASNRLVITDNKQSVGNDYRTARILFGYPYSKSAVYRDLEQSHLSLIDRYNQAGFDVEGFCLTLNPPGRPLSFQQLDKAWRHGNLDLLKFYERLEEKLSTKDILINNVGINLHPEFVERLPAFTIFQHFDDPESSEKRSRYTAAAYDLALVGNIAELDTYRSWGVRNVEWIPLGFFNESYDPGLTYEDILTGQRDIDLFMMINRDQPKRKPRLDQMAAAFPDGHFYGKGWPRGILPYDQELNYMRRAKIGPNFHLSTGPINFRTYEIPANGVMLICDNKSHLGGIYKVGREVAGFETIDECIDLCRYYLAHDDERRRIAADGWKRAVDDYNEIAVFRRVVSLAEKYMVGKHARRDNAFISLSHQKRTIGIRLLISIYHKLRNAIKFR